MTRYYYDDPLAAAFMAKHFGMAMTNEKGWCMSIADILRNKAKAYIHPAYLSLLEPMVGDLILSDDASDGVHVFDWVNSDLNNVWASRQKFKIIQRQGLAFHWPKQES